MKSLLFKYIRSEKETGVHSLPSRLAPLSTKRFYTTSGFRNLFRVQRFHISFIERIIHLPSPLLLLHFLFVYIYFYMKTIYK